MCTHPVQSYNGLYWDNIYTALCLFVPGGKPSLVQHMMMTSKICHSDNLRNFSIFENFSIVHCRYKLNTTLLFFLTPKFLILNAALEVVPLVNLFLSFFFYFTRSLINKENVIDKEHSFCYTLSEKKWISTLLNLLSFLISTQNRFHMRFQFISIFFLEPLPHPKYIAFPSNYQQILKLMLYNINNKATRI